MAYYGKRREGIGDGGLSGEALMGMLFIVLAAAAVFLTFGRKLGVEGDGVQSLVAAIFAPPRFTEVAGPEATPVPLQVSRPRSIAETDQELAALRATGGPQAQANATQAQGGPAAYCAPGQVPAFGAGFAALRAQVGPVMGQPTQCEHGGGSPDEVVQQTTAGLAVYRASSSLARFTDGYRSWALLPDGNLAYWEGDAAPEAVKPLLG